MRLHGAAPAEQIDGVFTSDVILAVLAAQDRTVKLLPLDDTLKLPLERLASASGRPRTTA